MESSDHEATATSTVRRNKPCCSRLLKYCGGTDEILSFDMWRASLVELVATALLMFTLTTSIISCLDSAQPDPKILIPFAVIVNAFLFLLVTVPLTGGHMNPIFSFIAALKGLVTPSRAFAYVPSQCIGSVIGFLAVKSVMNHENAQKFSLGGCALNGLSHETALIIEFVCTFLVLFIGVTVAFDPNRSKELGLIVVCSVVAAAMAVAVFISVTVTGKPGYGGVGLNPARCLGAALVEGKGLWHGQWVFWVGPFLACVVYYGFSLHLPRDGSGLAGDCCFRSQANDRAHIGA